MKPLLRIVLTGGLLLSFCGTGTAWAEPDDIRLPQENPTLSSPAPSNQLGPQIAGDENWDSEFLLGINYSPMPSNSSAFAIAVSGTDVYMGGDFDQAGDVAAKNIAHWDAATHRWSALGAGVNNRVYAIAVHGNDVYVGGGFTQAGNVSVTSVAHWSKTAQAWSAMGGELTNGAYSPDVRAIAVADNGDVYAGGSFTKIGDITVNNIARWDGTSWHALSTGTGGPSPDVYAIAVSGSDVYVGGDFTIAGGSCACRHVGYWNGTTWSPLGGGTGGTYPTVNAIALSGTNVYLGGEFDNVIDSVSPFTHPVGHVAMWDTGLSAWNTMNGGVDDPDVSSLVVAPDGVYVGGRFNYLADGSTTVNRIARWNTSGWTSLSTGSILFPQIGVDSNLYSLAYSSAENSIYLGGFFTTAGSRTVNHAGRWSITDGDFYGLGNSVDGPITAMEQVGNKIFLAGNFNSAGGIPVTGLAAWDRSTHTWSALGTGISGCSGFLCTPRVYALKRTGDMLLVGGNFANAGGNPASRIAIWNPSTNAWLASSMTALTCSGTFCSPEVWAFETNGGYGIVAGGYFDKAGGTTVNNIARWTSAWNAFGSGVSGGTVKTIYYKAGGTGSTLYIGGIFSSPANFAIWSGSSWSAASSSPNDQVNSIRGFDSDHIIVGGNFAPVGTDAYNHVALYDTATGGWSAAGSGLNGPVYSLFSSGSQVFAAGDFTASGITGMNRVAVYLGGAWSGLGSGADKPVQAVLYDGHAVYIAGSFLNAGAKPSTFFGRWSPPYALYLPQITQ